MAETKPSIWSKLLIAATIFNTILFIIYLILAFTLFKPSCDDVQGPAPLYPGGSQIDDANQLAYDLDAKTLSIYSSQTSGRILDGQLGLRIDKNDYSQIELSKVNSAYKVRYTAKSRAANIELNIRPSKTSQSNDVSCNSYEWTIDESQKNAARQEFEDCFKQGDFHWYGQSESKDQQYWPINNISYDGYKPYLTGLIDDWGSIIERYWLSTSGVAIIVDWSNPLFLQKTKSSFCFLASAREPYREEIPVRLKYDICKIDAASYKQDFMKRLHLFVMNNYFAKPIGIPDERMFRSPIWSTWANFKANISESIILQYARDIRKYNYSNSQLEIDDKWQIRYGEFEFDKTKFPDMKSLTTQLNALGFRVTMWIIPFINLDANNLLFVGFNFLAVRVKESLLPGLTSWWQGPAAIIFDATNPNASDWFVSELEQIKRDANIDSFKFDAGETNWLPKFFDLTSPENSPDIYANKFARMSSRLGRLIEVRVATQTQDLPIFVRMLDKDSNWGFDNGLKSVLTTTLTMGILGYPFVLPDMIGGNAYSFDGDNIDFQGEIAYPDYQLYIRWAQMTAFLPSMQFSIPPWHYDLQTNVTLPVSVNDICKKYVDLHENLIYPYLIKYARMATQTGEPIIRPVWWIDNSDKESFVIDDEFLIGDEILVAPITDEDAYSRDVYFPAGDWIHENGTVYTGPGWLKNFPAPIENIPYFIKKTSP